MVEPFQVPSFTVPVVSTRKALPAVPTEKSESGLEVPMPILPLARTVNTVEVAVPLVVEAMVKRGVLAVVVRVLEMESKYDSFGNNY